jgi:chemotaxis methyl-accepting protein methylase
MTEMKSKPSMPAKKHVFEAELGPKSDLQKFFRDNMVVTRTDFFRHQPMYRELESYVLPALFGGPVERTQLQVWSAGCSDGREPYSLAMVIHRWMAKEGLAIPFKVEGSDINPEQVAIGKAGFYRIRERERIRLKAFEGYYHFQGRDGIKIAPVLMEKTALHVENFIIRPVQKQFDIIVCSNVLLYYEPEYRKEIVAKLDRFLLSGGFLYIEAIGSRAMKAAGYQRLRTGSHFFRKVCAGPSLSIKGEKRYVHTTSNGSQHEV